MKRNNLIIFMLFFLIPKGYTQLITTDNQGLKRSSLLQMEQDDKVSYRGYVETLLDICEVPVQVLTVAPVGVQLNPYFSLYAGLTMPLLYKRYKTLLETGDKYESSFEYWSHFFIEGKYNLNSIRLDDFFNKTSLYNNQQVIPFVRASIGFDVEVENFIPALKVGLTFYNAVNLGRFSIFVGVTAIPYEINAFTTINNYDSYYHFSLSKMGFCLGINYELGGNAGFKPRHKNQN